MALETKLRRYRMTIALAIGLLGPTVVGTLFSFAGMTSATEVQTLTKLVVWSVGAWALGAAAWELYSGFGRWRSSDEEKTVDSHATP